MRFVIILFLLIPLTSFGQAPEVFYVTFGGEGKDRGNDVIELPRRQYLIAGQTTSETNGGADAIVILIDSMGQQKWSRLYGGTQTDWASSILYNPVDSGYFLCGTSSSYGEDYDFWVVRLDKYGNEIWNHHYGTKDWDFATSACWSKDSNIIICGFTENLKFGRRDGYIQKIDITGNLIWEKQVGGMNDDEFVRVRLKSNGNLLVGGNSKSYGDAEGDFWFYEVSTNGDSLLSNTIGQVNKAQVLYDFIFNSDNQILIAGSIDTSYNNNGKNVSYIYLMDTVYNFIKDQRFDGKGHLDRLTSVCESQTVRGYVFTRRIFADGLATNLQVLSVNEHLDFQLGKDHGDTYNDEGLRIINTSDKGYAIVGYRSKIDLPDEDLYFLKLDSLLSYAPIVLSIMKQQEDVKGITINQYVIRTFEDVEYSLHDISGGCLMKGKINKEGVSIAHLNKGLYFLFLRGSKPVAVKILKE